MTEKPIKITVATEQGEPYVSPKRTLAEEVALQEQAIAAADAGEDRDGGLDLASAIARARGRGGVLR